ncbi:sugar phosphate isomerase/epimerase family protein [Microbacterium sp. ASV81]|uniref:TIM barrel protein n=1 Tax=Microbacterium capsulatum TaxID=3041921 RepID=A0ABU0XGZ7_9MICO|nr:TIM barrel protein [Microbacterium sp. ASV81]MDQ4214406.1 TIM barrel protein [Microbacterium sp. ASV81]
MPQIQSRFEALLSPRLNDAELADIPELTAQRAATLIERIDGARLFGHAYALLTNLTYGTYGPHDVLDFAYDHELAGVCIHLLDGEERSLGAMSDDELRRFGDRARALGLDVHLEISTTDDDDVAEVIRIAGLVGVRRIRVYSRFEGRLSSVLSRVEADLRRLAALADEHDLHFTFEQHEELKAAEIAALLRTVDHPRLHALFDFGNMINAAERPMDAFAALAPHLDQVHMKGVHIMPEQVGTGHRGVLMGSAEDDLPGARMLFETLMLGSEEPQVIALALEQENLYRAPAFRHANEEADPFIPYREMSTTGIPQGWHLPDLLQAERRWAVNQVTHVREILTRLRELASCRVEAEALAGAR